MVDIIFSSGLICVSFEVSALESDLIVCDDLSHHSYEIMLIQIHAEEILETMFCEHTGK